jgi:hypothetical protein
MTDGVKGADLYQPPSSCDNGYSYCEAAPPFLFFIASKAN